MFNGIRRQQACSAPNFTGGDFHMKRCGILGFGQMSSCKPRSRSAAFPGAWRGMAVLLGALSLVLLLLAPAWAGDGALDPTFITGTGQFSGVQTIPEIRGQAGYPNVSGSPYNGYSLIFGTFWGLNVGGTTQNNSCIARLTNVGGALDTTFVNNQNLN